MKPTLAKDLPAQWAANKDSVIKYLQKVHQGIKGYVMDSNGQVVSNARVIVEGIDKHVTTTARGEYWRLLTLNDISTLEFSTLQALYLLSVNSSKMNFLQVCMLKCSTCDVQ